MGGVVPRAGGADGGDGSSDAAACMPNAGLVWRLLAAAVLCLLAVQPRPPPLLFPWRPKPGTVLLKMSGSETYV
jgi:hypothetical protein